MSTHRIEEALATFPKAAQDVLRPKRTDLLRKALTPYEEHIFLPTRAGKLAELDSRINPVEAAQLIKLRETEAAYEKLFELNHRKFSFIQGEYETIQNSTDSLDVRTHKTLALTTFAMRHAFSEGGKEFDLWPTNRLALIRGLNSWLTENANEKGLIIQSKTSAGKSLTVAPGLLPSLLLIRSHLDVAAQRPTTRDRNHKRFQKLANLFDIRTEVFHPELPFDPLRNLITLPLTPRDHALHADVTYLKIEDLGLNLIEQLRSKNPSVMLEAKNRGLILDEVDAATIDERLVPMVIAGPQQRLVEALSQVWHADFTTHEQTFLRLHLGSLQEDMTTLSGLFETRVQDPELLLKLATARKIFSLLPEVRHAQTKKLRPYYDKNGDLTSDGWYDIKCRLWSHALNQPDNPNVLLPDEWDDFFEKLVPGNIAQAINAVGNHLKEGIDYRRTDEGLAMPLSSFTGYPQEGREFDALTQILLWTRDTLSDPSLAPPVSVHNNLDELSLDELFSLAYSKFLCLTGSELDDPTAYLLEHAHNLRMTIIPSTKEGIPLTPDNYIPVSRKREKFAAIAGKISVAPTLIEVPSIKTGESLRRYLRKKFSDYTINLLTAKNAYEANTIITRAGNPKTITIVRGMAKREEDITLSEESIYGKFLNVLSYEPGAYQSDDQQVAGRAGRRGEPGAAYFFVSPDDDIFKAIGDRALVRRVFAKGDRQKIVELIREGQAYNRNRQLASVESHILRVTPLVDIRNELYTIRDYKTRSLILSVWPSFLELMRVRFQEYASGWKNRSPLLHVRMQEYRNETKDLFHELVKKASTGGYTEGLLEEWFLNTANNETPEKYDSFWPK